MRLFLRLFLPLALGAALYVLAPWPQARDYAGASPVFSARGVPVAAGAEWESPPLPPVPGRRYLVSLSVSGPARAFLRAAPGGKESALREGNRGEERVFPLAAPAGEAPCRLVVDGGRDRAAVVVAGIGVRPVLPAYGRARAAAIALRAGVLGALFGFVAWGLRPGADPVRGAFLYRRALPLLLAAVAAAGMLARFDREHGFNGLVSMGAALYDRATDRARQVDFEIATREGYDGAQYAEVALDPLLSQPGQLARALDAPSYRAKRIGLPWLAWIAGLGRPAWVIQAESVLNAAFWLLLLAVLLRAFPAPSPEHAAVLAGVLLATGTLESLRNALTDLPATALLAAALVVPLRARPLAWGAAVLTRETSLLAAPFLLGGKGGEARWKWAAALLAAAVFLGWFAYVSHLFPHSGGTALANLGWPLRAMAQRIGDIPATGGWGVSANLWAAVAMVSLSVQAAFLLRHPRPGSAAWRMGICFVPLFLCVQHPVWESYYAVTRAILPMTVAFHWELAARRGKSFWLWWIPANAYAWHGLLIYLFPPA